MTQRRWLRRLVVVGLVSCDDVKSLQSSIHDYRTTLQASITQWQTAVSSTAPVPAGQAIPGMPNDNSDRSVQAWADLAGRCASFEDESCYIGLFAGSQHDRGRALVTELDGWRDWLAAQRQAAAPNVQQQWTVPSALPIPSSDLGLAGGLAWAAAAVVAFLLLRELH